jgi:hypothetical protein
LNDQSRYSAALAQNPDGQKASVVRKDYEVVPFAMPWAL